MKANLLLILTIIFFPIGHSSAQVRLEKTDEMSEETFTELKQFLDTLYVSALRKDTAVLFKSVYKEVYLSYIRKIDGMVHNLESFKSLWQLNDPATSRVWNIIIDILESDGFYYRDRYSMPFVGMTGYIGGVGPEDERFWFDHHVCIRNLPVYEQPDSNSRIITWLDKGTMVYNKQFGVWGTVFSDTWIEVDFPGQKGWIRNRYLYSTWWDINIEKINREWKIESFSIFD